MIVKKERIAYKCIPKGMTSHGHKWVVGKWYKHEGELELCESGFHASKLLLDAFSYVVPFYVCKVAYRGEVIYGDDKFVAREMKVLSKYRWSERDSVEFCVSLKERMCKINSDERVRLAFEAAEAYLNNPCQKTKDAARAAASDAASYAARAAASDAASYAARAAARAAAGYAASDAASDAASYAARAAASYAARAAAGYAARGAAEKQAQHRTIMRIINKKKSD